MGKNSGADGPTPASAVTEAWEQASVSFERFCLTAGLSALSEMMEQDATALCGPRYGHCDGKPGHRWGKTRGKIGCHGGKVSLERPRVRGRDGQELQLPSWEAGQSDDLLGRWAMNLMLINIATRRFARAPGRSTRLAKKAGTSPPQRAPAEFDSRQAARRLCAHSINECTYFRSMNRLDVGSSPAL